jgi:GNAT superfamily N-acetyltransferase
VYVEFNKIENLQTVVLAYFDGIPAGCGCFKENDTSTVEIKRMFVPTEFRGKGISKLILETLENWAKELGFIYSILETGKPHHEAIGLYTKFGYQQIHNYGQYANMPHSVCFKKELVPGRK